MENLLSRKIIRNSACTGRIQSVNTILFYIFLFNVVFIPNDNFNLKIISLGVLFVINVPCLIRPRTKPDQVALFCGFFVTLYVIVKSVFLTGELIANVKIGYPGLILLLFPVIRKNKIEFYKAFIVLLRLLSLFTVAMAALDLLNIVPMFNNPILTWFSNSSNAMVGKGEDLPFYYMIFFKTSPLLFVCLIDSLKTRKIQWLCLSIVALVISGTRANVIMLAITVVSYLCFFQKSKRKCLIAGVILTIIAVVVIVDGRLVDFIIDMFQRKSGSDSVRDGHLKGILEVWSGNPLKFLIGSGFSSEFYSYGIGEFTCNIELSYWNLLRQVGLFPFCLIMFGISYPMLSIWRDKENRAMLLAYIAYLAIAYSNPFLYSSTGMTIVLFMYYVANSGSHQPKVL